MSHARGESMLNLTATSETLIQRASEQATHASTVVIVKFFFTKESVVDGNSASLLCRECSEPRNSQSSRLPAVFNDQVKIEPMTGIEVLKSVGTVTTTRKQEVLGANITRN